MYLEPWNTVRTRLISSFIYANSVISLMLAVLAITLSLGLAVTSVLGPDYTALLSAAPKEVWAITFLIYGFIKLTHSILRTHLIFKLIFNVVGMYIWAALFGALVVFSEHPVGPTEPLLLLPIIVEMWYLTLLIFSAREEKACERQRRHTDGIL